MKYEFMREHEAMFSVSRLCEVLEVSRSGYYSWKTRKPSPRKEDETRLRSRIVALHEKSRRTYGSPRVHAELRASGEQVSRKRVARIMRENGIRSKHVRKFRKTTDSAHHYPIAANVLNREFRAKRRDSKWATDITYIPTGEGWLFLAVVIDLYSRKVVGWSISENLETPIVVQALKMALADRKPPRGLLHHSDRGCQYASSEYRALLEERSIVASMSRARDCWDNAVVESFFKTLKVESAYRTLYKTKREARADIFQFIEGFYNRQRRHSALGYKSPVDFEQRDMAA